MSTPRKSAALATAPSAREAAEAALASRSSALSAVMAGFFAAAGDDPGVLFSPVQLLVGGLGAGAFAYDGRARQPGREAKRPRGFLTKDDVPMSAHAAVPASLVALSIACAFQSGASLLAASKVGVARARGVGARRRADFIDRMAGLGATCLSEPALKRTLLARFGPAEEGQWGHRDLAPPEGVQAPVQETQGRLEAPWSGPTPTAEAACGVPHAVLAIDGHGLFCALSYTSLPEDLLLDEFEVAIPPLARPVMRGIPRMTPGAALPSPTSLALLCDEQGKVTAAEARTNPRAEALCLVRDPETKLVGAPVFSIEADPW